jgi:hypothetical protein
MNRMIIAATLSLIATGCASQGQTKERMPSSAKTSGSFSCSNSPAKKWGTYYCVSAQFSDDEHLHDIMFGTCEGSSSAEEEEPVDQVEIKSLKHDPSLAASSSEWKDASAFDVSTKEHGKATMLVHPDVFKANNNKPEVRLKVKDKDLRLMCGSSLDK